MRKTLEEKLLPEHDRRNRYVDSSSEDSDSLSCVPNHPKTFETSNRRNTGVKGVLEDYQNFLKEERIKEKEKEIDLNKEANRFSVNSSVELEDQNEFIETEEVFQEYRLNQMKKLLNKYEMKKQFGDYKEVNRETFLNEIDEDPSVIVVIHLFNSSNETCLKMHRCLESMSKDYPTVKFRHAIASSLNTKWTYQEGFPALIVYKGGQLMIDIVNIPDFIGKNISIEKLESLFLRYQIINSFDIAVNRKVQTTSNRLLL